MDHHEEAFINTFLTKAYRKRCLAKKGLPREDLWHVLPSKLNDRTMFELPNNIRHPDLILKALRQLHPVETGFCISADSEIDGKTIMMKDFTDLEGTILSVIPGKLAYYQSESDVPTFQCLLVGDYEMASKAAAVLKDISAHY